jgi:hypothetical protein
VTSKLNDSAAELVDMNEHATHSVWTGGGT